MPTVWIPPLMRDLTKGEETVRLSGKTIREIIDHLESLYPGFKDRVYDSEADRIRPSISVAVDGEITRLGLIQRVKEKSEIHFIPAISGGR